MILSFNKKVFNKEELYWAISLIENEYNKLDRNTPEKIASLIEKDFDVKCDPSDIYNYYNLNEDYGKEERWVEYYQIGFGPIEREQFDTA